MSDLLGSASGGADTPEAAATRKGASAAIGVVLVVVLALLVLMIAPQMAGIPAGTQTDSSATENAAPTGQTTNITVGVDGMSYTPDVLEVPAGNRLVVTFQNTGDQPHDLKFESGAATPVLNADAEYVLDVGVIDADMDGWCTLPGHRQMGMELKVVAVGAPAGGEETADTEGPAAGHAHEATGTLLSMTELLAEAELHDPYPAALEPLPAASGPETREYTFEVLEDEEGLGGGLVRPVWTYNGTSPGPVLHGRVGDEFVITLVNNGTMGHSIDFHAGENAPDQVMRTIDPGESLEYRFTATRSGIWMYHCSTMPMDLHIANGMFGAVVIEPEGLDQVDRSYVLIQSEFYQDEPGASAADKLTTLIPDVVMFNGRAFQYDAHPLPAEVGERVRFWALDVGPNSPLSFHIVGTQFDTVWSEGAYSVYRGQSADGLTQGVTGAQVLPLLAAQGGFVELVPVEPGHYPIVNHVMTLAHLGAHGILEVE